jgi:uncharacterized protein (DUF362 family)
MNPRLCHDRRTFLKGLGAGLVAASAPGKLAAELPSARALPRAPVAIHRCRRYDFNSIRTSLARMFEWLGGVPALVSGKIVTVKINLTGAQTSTTYTLSPAEATFTHPLVTLAACSLFKEYGARRIIIADSLNLNSEDPKVDFDALGYVVSQFASTLAGLDLVWESTRNRGSDKNYRRLPVGSGDGYFYSFFEVNHRYADTDVLVSIPKLKNHQIAGVTLGMKNLFGVPPNALYSKETVDENTTDARIEVLHNGVKTPAGGEVLPAFSLHYGERVPRIVVDIVRARPIDLTIIDGIVTTHGGEGQWQGPRLGIAVPGLLIAGRNCVCTDAVTTAVMGYNPEAEDYSKPFQNGVNTFRYAALKGMGTNRIADIDVVGMSIAEARYTFLPSYKEPPQQ